MRLSTGETAERIEEVFVTGVAVARARKLRLAASVAFVYVVWAVLAWCVRPASARFRFPLVVKVQQERLAGNR